LMSSNAITVESMGISRQSAGYATADCSLPTQWKFGMTQSRCSTLLLFLPGKELRRRSRQITSGFLTLGRSSPQIFVKFWPQGGHITACNGRMTEIKGVGNIMVQGSFWNTPVPLLIRNVLYAPGLTNNLLSGIMLMEAGLKGKLHESGLDLYNQTSGERSRSL